MTLFRRVETLALFLFSLVVTLMTAPDAAALGSGDKKQEARAVEASLINHVVAANEDGLGIDPQTDEPFTSAAFGKNIDHLLDQARILGDKKNQKDKHGNTVVKVLVHVHGGLNGKGATLKRMERFADAIMDECDEWYYPVFVRWPSGFVDTYFEHLIVLNGNKSVVTGTLLAPFVFTIDLLQFCAHAPLDWWFQGVNFKDRMVATALLPDEFFSRNWKTAEFNYKFHCSVFSRSTMCVSNTYWSSAKSTDKLYHYPLNIMQSPFQVSLGTLVQGAFARESWENMKRRTSNMLHPAPLFDRNDPPLEIWNRALGSFFERLNEKATNSPGYKYEITFVGHSMGAIVLNKVFTQYRNQWIRGKTIANIVYMGAADSVNNTLNAIKPLLQAYNESGNGSSLTFHNLSLNRVAEISERPAWGFAPRGSLLEDIDQHLEVPQTAADRTMGSEINVFQCLHMFDEVQQYCKFKSFDRKAGQIPAEHGDFNKCPFWRESFWDLPSMPDKGSEGKGSNYFRANWAETDPAIQNARKKRIQMQKAIDNAQAIKR